MKLYTRKGDAGETQLFSGRRAAKDDPRVAAVGDLDELSAALGLARLANAHIAEALLGIQREVYTISAIVSAEGRHTGIALDPATVDRLERSIDEISERLPPLRDFIIPGRQEASARLHLARAVARRAERNIAALADPVPPDEVLRYLNRLSDLLFAQARDADHRAGLGDVEARGSEEV